VATEPELLYVDTTAGNPPSIRKVADSSYLPDISAHPQIKRVVCISDTHERHHQVSVPSGSVLIHCGDILTINRHFTTSYSQHKLEDFARWLGSLAFPGGKVLVGGNHDAALEALGKDEVRKIFHRYDQRVSYLEDELCTVADGGLTVWGSPVSHGSSENRAFQSSAEERFGKIPRGTLDILITHAPISENTLEELRPRLHVCGHIHNQYGASTMGETVCVNASIMDGRYKPTHGAVVVDMVVCGSSSAPPVDHTAGKC